MNLDLCKSILQSIGHPEVELSHIAISGQDPILPSPFFIGEAGASVQAAVGYISSELWYLKTRQKQTIEVSVRDAAIAQRSHHYVRLLHTQNDKLWDPISGFYETKDNRWIQFHCNFSHHKQGVLSVLKCLDEKEAVKEATKEFEAHFLEYTLQHKGMCAAMVRSTEEWENHPQYKAIAHLPPIEIVKLCDSAPKQFPEGTKPLQGIKILDLTRVIAGPVCGKTLAEHGAKVLLIRSPHLPNILPLLVDTSCGKQSVLLDLDIDENKKKLLSMAKDADIFCQSYRPGGLDAKGFSPADLVALNPYLIYVTFDTYGHLGPWSSFHGFDTLVQSVSGIALEQGGGVFPQHLPAQTLDYITGYLGALGAMEALRRRALFGGSYLVRISLAKTAKWLLDLGRINTDAFHNISIPNRDELTDLLITTNSDFGPLECLKPVLKMSETSPYYTDFNC